MDEAIARDDAVTTLRRQLVRTAVAAPLLVAATLVAAIVGYAFVSGQPKTYEAEATLVVGSSLWSTSVDVERLLTSQQLASAYAEIATTRPILDDVRTRTGIPATTEELQNALRVETAPDSSFLRVIGAGGTPQTATLLANGLAAELVEATPALLSTDADVQGTINQQLEVIQGRLATAGARAEELRAIANPNRRQSAQLAALQTEITELLAAYTDLEPLSSGNAANLLTIVEPAVEPERASGPSPLIGAMLAGMLGFLIAGALLFGRRMLDDKVRDPDDIRAAAGLPTLAIMPRGRHRVGATSRSKGLAPRRRDATEAFMALRWNVAAGSGRRRVETVLVTSSTDTPDKTDTTVNLAMAYALSGQRVLLVDADLRRPRLHRVLGLANDNGLATLLSPRSKGDQVPVHPVPESPRVGVMTAGVPDRDPAELLGSAKLKDLIAQMEARADVVILDGPSLGTAADAILVGRAADVSVLVVDNGKVRRSQLREDVEALARAGVRPIGAVLRSRRRLIGGRPRATRYSAPTLPATVVDDRRAQEDGRAAGTMSATVSGADPRAAATVPVEPGNQASWRSRRYTVSNGREGSTEDASRAPAR